MKQSLKAIALLLVLSFGIVGTAPATAAPGKDKPISIDNLVYSKVGKAAFGSVAKQLKVSKKVSSRVNFVVGPNVSKAEQKLERKLVGEAVKVFSKWYAPEVFTVVMFSEKDGAWADQTLANLGGSYFSSIADAIKQNTVGGSPCGFAFATVANDGTPIYYGCTDSFRTRDWVYQQTPPHEYFHLVQGQDGKLPQWLLEGSAAFFGAAIGYREISPNGSKSKEFFRGTSGNFDPQNQGIDQNRLVKYLRTLTPEQSKMLYLDLETFEWQDGDRLSHYALGGLATEVLVGVWGLDKYMEMLEKTNYSDWKASFQSTYGLSATDFYVKLVPYLRAAGMRMSVW
jgi:hypothetical protein